MLRYQGSMTVIFNANTRAQLEDWITPCQIEIVKVDPPLERLEWLARRAQELKEAMGSRYLCHEKNRVRRLDGRSYPAHEVPHSNIKSLQRSV